MPYCPLHSCKNLGGSLDPFWRKGQQKVEINLFWTRHLIPYNSGLRFLQKKHLAQRMGPIVLHTFVYNYEHPWSRFEEEANKVKKTHSPAWQIRKSPVPPAKARDTNYSEMVA